MKKFENGTSFTVIIPCKNRAKYLVHTLRTCSMQNYDNLDIVVSDDGSTDSTRDVVEDAIRRDPRIRLILHDHSIGMRDNFEYALNEVKPGFVIALGSDDGLLPDGIAGMFEVLQKTGMELLAWPTPLYVYPGVRGDHGQLIMYNTQGERIIESRTFLKRQAKKLHYLSDFESPMFYVKGVTSTRLINQVRSRSADHRFYACATPDGYSGIVLAGEVEKYAFSGRPFSIYGLSPFSQGLAYLSNDDEAKKASEAFYRKSSEIPMHQDLSSMPYSPLITLMTVDYLLRSRDLEGWPGEFPEIDYRKVIKQSIQELSHGLYGGERINRELAILNQIAKQHGISDYLRNLIKNGRRKPIKAPFEGSGISPSAFFLDASTFKIHDIYEAAYAVKDYYQLYLNTGINVILRAMMRSIKYRLSSVGIGEPFPSESEWAFIDPNDF